MIPEEAVIFEGWDHSNNKWLRQVNAVLHSICVPETFLGIFELQDTHEFYVRALCPQKCNPGDAVVMNYVITVDENGKPIDAQWEVADD